MARVPEPGNNGSLPERRPLSEEDSRRVLRAASLRPVNLLMLALGVLASVIFSWWFAPLTVVTYALLVLLASRDPFFQRRTLGGNGQDDTSQPELEIPPERRVRWLPRGETRRKIEEALEVYRKTVTAIEDSDDVTRSVLEDAVPKLHAAANRLVDAGTNREKAATVIAELRSLTNPGEDREASIEKLQDEIHTADAEIFETYDQLVSLRMKIAQVSLSGSHETRAAATQMNASLDELNLRLEALKGTMSSYEEPLTPPEDQIQKENQD